jgi:DNA-binding transcriptional ArsR family regulator
MAKLFPFRGESSRSAGEPRLVDIDDDAAEEVFAALSSDTARVMLSRLYESPETASGVAEAADTSIQNARYHLEKLESAGLVEPVDTWYSSRGTEMTVYAPTNEPLVVAAGNEESKGVLRRALERVVGAVAVLALASVVIDRLAGASGGLFGGFGGGPGDESAPDGGMEPTGTETPLATGAPDETGVDPATATDAQVPADASPGGGLPATETSQHGVTTSSEGLGTTTPTPTETPTPTPTETPTPTPTDSPTPTETPAEALAEATPTAVEGALDAVPSAPPGALFFAGGLAVIAAGAAWWYWRRYRPMYGA